ncbi:hypothetical protein [Kitasatospora sp. NPDC097691]
MAPTVGAGTDRPGGARAIEGSAGDEPPLDVFLRYLDEWRASTAAEPQA